MAYWNWISFTSRDKIVTPEGYHGNGNDETYGSGPNSRRWHLKMAPEVSSFPKQDETSDRCIWGGRTYCLSLS